MSEFLIKSYISKLTVSEVDRFARKNGLDLSDCELNLILNYIRNDWHTIIYGNPRSILDRLKLELNEFSYNKIERLYINFKEKYKNYL